MRLLRRKLYRAFPELDRFTDDQCRRFVGAANSSWRSRATRWTVVGLLAIATTVGGIVGAIKLAEWLDRRMIFNGTIGYLGLGILLIIGSGAGLCLGLIARDAMLRRRVRRLLKARGACPHCRYSLLGMRVGSDLTIICPECGHKSEADPALDELATDETGARVFGPQFARDNDLIAALRRRRHRAFLKWSAIGVAAFFAIAGAAYGLWWWSLVEQARVARAERNTKAHLADLRAAMWPGGARPDSARQWEEFLSIIRAVHNAQTSAQLSGKYGIGNYQTAVFDAAALTAEKGAYDKKNGDGSFEATRRLTLDVLATCKSDGTIDGLRRLTDLAAPIRQYDIEDGQAFFEINLDGMGDARSVARFNGARMIVAMNERDGGEYAAAVEQNLLIARICARQGTLIEHLVAIAIQDLTISRVTDDQGAFPNPAWRRAVLDVLLRRADAPPIAEAMEVERVGGLDGLQHFFSDPKQVRNAQLGLGSAMFWGPMRPGPFDMGTYAENKAELNAMYDGVIATARQDAWLPAPIIPTSTLPVVNMLTPALGRVMTSAGKAEYEYRRAVFAMAVRVYKDQTGAYPAKPDDLAALVPEGKFLIDPNTGKQFWFTDRPVTGAGAPRTVLDIINFPSKPAATPDSDAAPAPDGAPSPPTLAP